MIVRNEEKPKTLDAANRDYDKARRKKLRKVAHRSSEFFVPTGVGEEFIGLVGGGDYFIVLDSAANGTGKTTLGVNVLVNIMYGRQNGWFDYPLFNNWKFPKRGRIVSDPTTIQAVIIPELKSWLPRDRYTTEKRGKNFESYWKTDTGFEFEIMSNEQDPKEFESATLGWAWLDEPPPQSIYKATVARLRKGGVMFITATPLAGSAWMYDQIVTNVEGEHGRRTFITADVESACKEHGTRGFLEHAHIQDMLSEYNEDDMQARAHGLFQHLVGLVFKRWERKVHVIRPFPVSPREFSVIEMLDPHPRNPDAVTWLAVDRHGQKFIVDELFENVTGDEELAMRIKNKASQYRVVHRLADPSAFVEDQHTGMSLATKLANHGLRYSEATKARRTADRRIADALNYERVGNEFIRTPELYVFNYCTRTIFEFEHYRWDEWRGRSRDEHGPKEKTVDKDDHFIENIGRGLIQEPAFIPYDERLGMGDGALAGGGVTGEIEESSFDPFG